MASLTRCTWVWVSCRSWWWIGRPGVLQSMGLQRVRHDWATKLNLTDQGSNPHPLQLQGEFLTNFNVKSVLLVATVWDSTAVVSGEEVWGRGSSSEGLEVDMRQRDWRWKTRNRHANSPGEDPWDDEGLSFGRGIREVPEAKSYKERKTPEPCPGLGDGENLHWSEECRRGWRFFREVRIWSWDLWTQVGGHQAEGCLIGSWRLETCFWSHYGLGSSRLNCRKIKNVDS